MSRPWARLPGRRRRRRHLLRPRRHRDPVPARARHAGDRGRAVADLVVPRRGLVAPQGRGPRAAARRRPGEGRALLPDSVWSGNAARPDHRARLVQIGDTRLGLQQAEAGQNSHIALFGIRVAPFDLQKVTAGLLALGARVIPSPYEPDVVRLTDPDGIGFRNRRPGLKTRAHARWSGTSRDVPLRRWSGRLKANADRKFTAVRLLFV